MGADNVYATPSTTGAAVAAICVPVEPLTPTTPRTVDRTVAMRTVRPFGRHWPGRETAFVRWAMAWSETVAFAAGFILL